MIPTIGFALATTFDAPMHDAYADAGLLVEFARRFELREADAADSGTLQRFIQRSFSTTHGANIEHFMPRLMGLHERGGGLVAAFGMRAACLGPLFLESYLDTPIEIELATRFGRIVPREDIIEVGNLSANHPGATRWLILAVNLLLHREGYRWIAFTATHMVRNALLKLDLRPLPLRAAALDRLPAEEHAHWGNYYAQSPMVMTGELVHGYRSLLANRDLQRRLLSRRMLPVTQEIA
ncbi:MAG: thermostable hemolysin [Burkholderiaceae bacterium]